MALGDVSHDSRDRRGRHVHLHGRDQAVQRPGVAEIRDSLDVPPGLWRVIGVLEWLGAAGVVIGLAYGPLGVLASIALAGLLVGAMVTRLRAARRHGRSEAAGLAGDVATLALAIVTAVAFASQL